jgi:hypothetical protein
VRTQGLESCRSNMNGECGMQLGHNVLYLHSPNRDKPVATSSEDMRAPFKRSYSPPDIPFCPPHHVLQTNRSVNDAPRTKLTTSPLWPGGISFKAWSVHTQTRTLLVQTQPQLQTQIHITRTHIHIIKTHKHTKTHSRQKRVCGISCLLNGSHELQAIFIFSCK